MAVGRGSLAAHAPPAGAEAVEQVHSLARPLRGAHVVHVTAAGAGRRVPEQLGAMLPLAADAGLRISWRVLFGDPELAEVARELRDGLQGGETALSDPRWGAYRRACADAARALPECDLLVLHDPGTLGLAGTARVPTVWRCHVDASAAEAGAWERARPLAQGCAARTVAAGSFAPQDLEAAEAAPGIDPLSARNGELSPRLVGRVVRALGVDLARPFVVQVMSLDRWKDPHGTLEAFAAARERVPDLQLVLAADLADDWPGLKELSDLAQDREDVIVLTSYAGLGNLELGALQRLARVSIHRALREGYGLAASEALWKGTPVVGGREGGVALQVRDGVDGYLTDEPEETGERVAQLVADPGLATEMGRAGHEAVRERRLVVHALGRELEVLANTLGA
jgi:trehalose synthase